MWFQPLVRSRDIRAQFCELRVLSRIATIARASEKKEVICSSNMFRAPYMP